MTNRVLLINLCNDLSSNQITQAVNSMLTHEEEDGGVVNRDVYISDLVATSPRSDELKGIDSIRTHFENFESALENLAEEIQTLFRWGKPSFNLYADFTTLDIESADLIIWVGYTQDDFKKGLEELQSTPEYQRALEIRGSDVDFRYTLLHSQKEAVANVQQE